ncbi:MAG: response regulator [Verrucomicrobiota bacterium]
MDRPLRILLVDDSDDDILLIKNAFKKCDRLSIIDAVNDGQEALNYLKQIGEYSEAERPDMLLLDINMPVIGGFEVLEHLSKHDDFMSLPVVMLTTSDNEDDVTNSYKLGACSYIRKPDTFSDMKGITEKFENYWCSTVKIP